MMFRIPRATAGAALAALAVITAAGAAAAAPRLPNTYCEVKKVSTCTPEGACKPLGDVLGQKVPGRITIDFENRIISEPHGSGWINSARIGTLARSAGQLIAHGIEGPFSWQILISDKDGSMSYTAATADLVVSAFGSCTNEP